MKQKKRKLCIVLNSVAPYRVPIYESLAESFEVWLLHGGTEANRSWTVSIPESIRTIKVWSLLIPSHKMTGVDGIRDRTYFHINLGLIWWLFRTRPDIVVSNELGLRTILSLLYGSLMRVPVWIWWGGTMHSEKNIGSRKRHIRRFIARFAKHWISYGVTSTEYLLSLGVARNDILQIQNCVRQETFRDARESSTVWFSELPRPVLLYVGQLSPRKGVDKLIEACSRFSSTQSFTLAIVGQGPEQRRLEALAQMNGLTNVVWMPNQSQANLSQIYRSANVFIFPTMEDNWGLVVNEALWSGLPVLCSEYAGCAKELLQEKNIFNPTSRSSWDAALSQVFDGTLPAASGEALKSWQEVSSMISASLEQGSPVM